MADVVIDNPILNRPFAEPDRHFRFGEDGITNEVVGRRRPSSYFVPIPESRRRRQLAIDEWTSDRLRENETINRVRQKVGDWRRLGRPGVTPTTRRLLEYWTEPARERPLFFCQTEALETAIWVAEVATRAGDAWIVNALRAEAEAHNPGLFRVAFKMATGSGKTVVMAMLIAWQTLNRLARPRDGRFADAFLVVAPGITIRDRLRVLLPHDLQSYYRARDLVPADRMDDLGAARIVIANFHGFLPREGGGASRTTKRILASGGPSPFAESPDQVVRRVCRELGTRRGIVVLNDEAHHCYRRRADPEEAPRLVGDERREAEAREQDARVWVAGLEAVAAKIGVRAVYDLSATPFFLRGSGHPEGTLFPWVVSDFALIDAIESGIVKVPRVPVADDSNTGPMPTYRDLWPRIRDDLPRGGRAAAAGGDPRLPAELEGALLSLYEDYARSYRRFAERERERPSGGTPPVFIVVCNNTSVSKLVLDHVAGWDRALPDGAGTVAVPGRLPLFSNVTEDGRWRDRPVTILVDSRQLESGEGMSAEFKRVAAREIDELRTEYRARHPGRDIDAIDDSDLLREVMNTVGKPGRLGEGVRCVVSVSMLTEGWDASTVTHILGVRAFGTQLLCEQVVGRGLRRTSYATDDDGFLAPEYAEVYGVPFSFLPCGGVTAEPPAQRAVTRVRALEDRAALEIHFPRVVGYRHETASEELHATFTDDHVLALSTDDVPTQTTIAGIVGATGVHTLDDLRARRPQEVAFHLAERVLRRYFTDRPWLFPQLVRLARGWMAECVRLRDHAFVQMLMLHQMTEDAAARIHRAIVLADPGPRTLVAVTPTHQPTGSTRVVQFDTVKDVMPTDPRRSHVSHVVADSGWEHTLAERLESMPEVVAYVKNQGLGFTIPYTLDGEERAYHPDFIARLDDGRGPGDLLGLVIEVTGAKRRDKAEKVATARDLWVPGVNNLGVHGRWAFLEIDDPADAANAIRAHVGASAVAA